jgi:hypothetical protein
MVATNGNGHRTSSSSSNVVSERKSVLKSTVLGVPPAFEPDDGSWLLDSEGKAHFLSGICSMLSASKSGRDARAPGGGNHTRCL